MLTRIVLFWTRDGRALLVVLVLVGERKVRRSHRPAQANDPDDVPRHAGAARAGPNSAMLTAFGLVGCGHARPPGAVFS